MTREQHTGLGAVVLAAGLSSRLEGFKPLLRLGGQSLVERAVRLLSGAGADEVLVVTGHRAEEVTAEVRRLGTLGLPARAVPNPGFSQGMFTSLAAGAAALGPGAGAFFVLPVDIPLVRPLTGQALLAARRERPDSILHPTFLGERGHPPLIPAGLVPDILAWKGDGGLAGFLARREARAPDEVLNVPVPDAMILFDVDDDADYARARYLAERLDIPERAECEALLALTPSVNARGLAHCRAVACHALLMAEAVNQARPGDQALDLGLVEAAALLHDLAKGNPGHERLGGELLRAMGFARVAAIVALHRDLRPLPEDPVSEAEIVYLADKTAQGETLVPVEARFQAKLEQWAHDPEAAAAIQGRLERALAVRRRIEHEAGAGLDSILGLGG